MGDRISISFKNGEDESVALFSHWRGKDLLNDALQYLRDLKEEVKGKSCEPLERLEPGTVMVDFIRDLTKDEKRITSDLYLETDSSKGDNSDNGHFTIDLNTLRFE
jgi:hypothetical protein